MHFSISYCWSLVSAVTSPNTVLSTLIVISHCWFGRGSTRVVQPGGCHITLVTVNGHVDVVSHITIDSGLLHLLEIEQEIWAYLS